MPFPSSIHMPGTWNSEGVHPGLFRPPVSPSPNHDYLPAPAFAQDRSSRRRWSRRDVLPFHDASHGDAYMDGEGLFGHPARLQHRPYALAGQLGAPMTMTEDNGGGFMGESMFSDSDYRTALGSKRSRDQMEATTSTPTQLFHLPSKPEPSTGWGSLAISTIGGVVGRFWEFCKIGSFKGFSAGGGASYQLTPSGSLAEVRPALPTPPAEETFCFQANPWRGDHHHQFGDGLLHAPFQPGRFLEEIPETPARAEGYTPGPARKRRQTDYLPELGRNWVMIREPGEAVERRTPSKFTSPQRPSSQLCNQNVVPSFASNRFSTPSSRPSTNVLPSTTPRRPSASRTPGGRLSTAGSSRLPRPASAASFASFAGQPAPTPSKIPVRANPFTTPPRGTSNAILPAAAVPASTATTAAAVVAVVMDDMAEAPSRASSRRRRHTALPPPPVSHSSPHSRRRTNSAASLASSRLERTRRLDESASRLDAEARQLATQRKLEEREADVRMSAFNKRLQDMIRQGQEALGTTVEVDMMEEEAEAEAEADMWWDDAL
ncbi:hypothetical protein ESCO_005380 [Escovopsis weberi]|uniref:Uncharacterized protein n=1 Tax=Escovopsis weberi TaxID=150374 RepID=A0A0M8MVX3_ESCWE|nr:hypothetical protein ESCO_005380 [Escovopsis weberi]